MHSMEEAREQVGRSQATIDRLTRAKLDLEDQLREVNRKLEADIRAALPRGLRKDVVSTARKRTLGYKLGRSMNETSERMERVFPITQTSLRSVFRDGIGKVFDVRILNSVDLIEQLRLSTPAIVARLKKELRDLRGLKFRMTIATTLEKTLRFVSDDPEVDTPTQHLERTIYFNSKAKAIVAERDSRSYR